MPNQTTTIIRNIKFLLKDRLAKSKGKTIEETEYNTLTENKLSVRKYSPWIGDERYFTLIHIIYLRLRESTKTHTDNDNEYIEKNLHHYNAITKQFSETFEISEDSIFQPKVVCHD